MKKFLGKTTLVITFILLGCRPVNDGKVDMTMSVGDSKIELIIETEHCKYYRISEERGIAGMAFIYSCECIGGYSCAVAK